MLSANPRLDLYNVVCVYLCVVFARAWTHMNKKRGRQLLSLLVCLLLLLFVVGVVVVVVVVVLKS